MADVDHPKTHVEDQDIDLPRKQPESPKREGIDPLTESDTMYPAENVKANAARFNAREEKAAVEQREAEGQTEAEAKTADTVADQKELNAQDNTPNSLLPETDEGNDNAEVTSDKTDKETGTENTSESNKTTDETLQDEVKKTERKVSTKTPKA